MANPQPTDAHLRINHSIYEQIIMSMFSERQLRVLFFILRLSWGCGKHSAYIPKQRDFELCGVGEGHIKQVINSLINGNIIIKDGSYYQFNKNFDYWHITRAQSYSLEKLTELVSLNLQESDQDLRELTELVSNKNDKLTESVSQNLPKREESTYRKGKFFEPEALPSSPHTPYLPLKKELNKYIYKDNNYIDNVTGEVLEVTESVSCQRAMKIWEQVLEGIQKKISNANYRTWLEPTRALTINRQDLIIHSPNASSVEYLNNHMRPFIESTLLEVESNKLDLFFINGGISCISKLLNP
jgi:phage replication O-like protein O